MGTSSKHIVARRMVAPANQRPLGGAMSRCPKQTLCSTNPMCYFGHRLVSTCGTHSDVVQTTQGCRCRNVWCVLPSVAEGAGAGN